MSSLRVNGWLPSRSSITIFGVIIDSTELTSAEDSAGLVVLPRITEGSVPLLNLMRDGAEDDVIEYYTP